MNSLARLNRHEANALNHPDFRGHATDVPVVKDPHHPTDAGGKPIEGIDFLRKYCAGRDLDETCLRVKQAVSADSSIGIMPKGCWGSIQKTENKDAKEFSI